MKEGLLKNIHWIIIFYAAFNLYTIYEDKMVELDTIQRTLASSKQKLNRNQSDLERVRKFNEDLQASKDRVDEVVKSLEKIQRQLPAEIKDTEIQNIMIDRFSNELRIQNPEITPKDERQEGFYFAKEYMLDAKGTYLQFLILFEKLEKLSSGDDAGRILNVKYVRMVVDENADKRSRFRILKLTLTIESFRYNANYQWKE